MRPIPHSSQTKGEKAENKGRERTRRRRQAARHPRMLSKTDGSAELDDDELWILVQEF